MVRVLIQALVCVSLQCIVKHGPKCNVHTYKQCGACSRLLQLIVVVVVVIDIGIIIILLWLLLLLLLLVFILLIVTIIIIVVVVIIIVTTIIIIIIIIIVIVKSLKDLESLEATRKCLEEELGVTKSSLEQQGQVVAEQSTEMETLRRCLLQVTQDEISQVEGGVAREGGVGGSSEDGEEGQVDGGGGNEKDEEEAKKVADKRKAQPVRIETLLNTTKVRSCLKSYVEAAFNCLLLLFYVFCFLLFFLFFFVLFVFVLFCFVLFVVASGVAGSRQLLLIPPNHSVATGPV